MPDEKFDCIVVGAGLAGLAAAYQMATDGLQVLVVEKAKVPGQKNVSGGRMYSHALAKLIPRFWEEAPVERAVTREGVTFMTRESAFSIDFESKKLGDLHNSYNVLRTKFDAWFSEKVAARGAMIIPGARIDRLHIEDGQVKGVIAGSDKLLADSVVLAEGANPLLAEQAGLKPPLKPHQTAVGVKEVIKLGADVINDRFRLGMDEGMAQVFVGAPTSGLPGGGFLYTNRDSVSLGIVMPIDSAMGFEHARDKRRQVPELVEDFRTHPYLAKLLRGGEVVEYSAHMVPEGGYRQVPKVLAHNGALLTGDSAGFVINAGLTFRGMDLAIESGRIAGVAVKRAKDKGDFTRGGLKEYERLLKQSFVLKDMKRFRNAPGFLSNPRMYTTYPEMISDLFETLFTVDGEKHLSRKEVRQVLMRHVSPVTLAMDALKGVRSL
ncbi:MAG: FAD-dependent oxidoreductase [Euryarchaeota archaeon]|nr:FAD-dependent oxidoreductase [Euryarchaeota archaeon]